MTEALKRLIEAVDADAFDRLDASARYNYFCNMWEEALGVATVSYEKGWAAYRKGDLNAAKALHDAMLPGWTACVGQNAHHGDWNAFVRLAQDGAITREHWGGTYDNAARAWLLAILRAKLAEATPTTGADNDR